MSVDDDEVELNEGMPVKNEAGDELGTLAGMLQEEEEEEAEFVVINDGTVDRLVPSEAILGVGDGALLLDLPGDVMAKFPTVRSEGDITDSEIELSYKIFDEHNLGGGEDEEDD